MAVRTNLLLPKELVEELDAAAGPRGRSRYVAEAVAEKLRQDRLVRAARRTAGVLSAQDHPEWATSDDVTAWVRERRADRTDVGSEP